MMNLDRFNKKKKDFDAKNVKRRRSTKKENKEENFEEQLRKHMSANSNRKFAWEQRKSWRGDEEDELVDQRWPRDFDRSRRNYDDFDRSDRQPRYNQDSERNFHRQSRSRDPRDNNQGFIL